MSTASESLQVAGLREPVQVLIDGHGIPHIRAESEDDLFFAQGYTVARDRLFQMDLWRRRGLGRLSAAFGEDFVERDRASRLFLYRGDLRAEWLAYGDGTRRIVSRFVEGVNARVAECLRDPGLLPEEFQRFAYLPEIWQPEDVASIRSHGLFGNLREEVARAATVRDLGPEFEDLRRPREPDIDVTVPEGLDLDGIDMSVLATYLLATSAVTLDGAKPAVPVSEGSNNWVIAGERTRSGRPILADDPHRAMTLPSLRYITHLECPAFSVIGAGEPFLPGVSIGHNGHVAFGLTIFPIDQEDLYVYELHPEDETRYRYRGAWIPFELEYQTVEVRGDRREVVALQFSVHGPLIHIDRDRHRGYGVRAAWLEPGMAPYLGSVNYMTAKTADEFIRAMDRWGAPGENQVYADTSGTIGWKAAGVVPIRPNWDGLLPVPGDGRYEWAGFRLGEELPGNRDPEEGFFATANQMNLTDAKDWRPIPISYEWYADHRHRRILEALEARDDWDVASAAALQNDHISLAARDALDTISWFDPEDGAARHALEELRAWDGDMSRGSRPALLFERWFRGQLAPELLAALTNTAGAGPTARQAAEALVPDETSAGDPRMLIALLIRSRREAMLAAAVERSLSAAWQDHLQAPSATWGDAHTSLLSHPLRSANSSSLPLVGPRPLGGSADTVGVASSNADGVQTAGASFRIVVDVGGWDESVVINTPGQSGEWGSEHFSDLYDVWEAGGHVPLPYTDEAVTAACRTSFHLTPGSGVDRPRAGRESL